jgi:transketolase
VSPSELAISPWEGYRQAIAAGAEMLASLSVVETGLPAGAASSAFAARFPSRYHASTTPGFVTAVVAQAEPGGPVFAAAPVTVLLEAEYPAIIRSLVVPRANAKLVGFPVGDGSPAQARDDLATMRGLPSMTVVAPADGPTVRTATTALAERTGPAYLRLPSPDAPALTDGGFAVGRARELRPGNDLAIVALGAMLGAALDVAEELGRVGVSVRVLDAASVKPFDEAAVLRAARDTGAILVAESAPVATGVGTLVAAMTAENYPVPVRRLGLPDVWPRGEDAARRAEAGVSLERMRDEAFELLRLRGKIT